MREILFKAKRKDNKEWIFGNLAVEHNKTYIFDTVNGYLENIKEVIPETVSQGTILKNGLKIFEGDIYHHGDPSITYTVVWHDSGLIGKQNKSHSSYAGLEAWADRIQIIRNIFDEEVK